MAKISDNALQNPNSIIVSGYWFEDEENEKIFQVTKVNHENERRNITRD